jgi:predicted signal transduction protein with EAL and GGDEF domain
VSHDTDGGDEILARQVVHALALPFEIGDRHLSISGSVGMARRHPHACDRGEWLRRADLAMYEEKASPSGVSGSGSRRSTRARTCCQTPIRSCTSPPSATRSHVSAASPAVASCGKW